VKCVVVGAGAWGLPAAAELARRGHEVTLVDQHGVANPVSSSLGPTRLWRLADVDPARVRLSMRGIDAMDRLESRSGSSVYLRRGLLWRDDHSLPALLSTMEGEGIEHTLVAPEHVDDYFPGLRPDGRHAVWQPDAGPVLAAASLAAQFRLFRAAGGMAEFGRTVVDVVTTSHGVRVEFSKGAPVDADVAVVAPGPGASTLLPVLGVDVPVHSYLEQVVHFGDPQQPNATDDYPCFFDGPNGDRDGIYAMPSPGIGYKVGLDAPLRDYAAGDSDRTPDRARTDAIAERVRHGLTGVPPEVIDAQVCSWTDSPDGKFIIDVLDGGIVIACGDSGEGFKYSALMGDVLADLAEGRTADPDVAAFGLSRFGAGLASGWEPHVLGRH
jgi:glycine/D-amino acid oxidase-like deaminating enzyme